MISIRSTRQPKITAAMPGGGKSDAVARIDPDANPDTDINAFVNADGFANAYTNINANTDAHTDTNARRGPDQ